MFGLRFSIACVHVAWLSTFWPGPSCMSNLSLGISSEYFISISNTKLFIFSVQCGLASAHRHPGYGRKVIKWIQIMSQKFILHWKSNQLYNEQTSKSFTCALHIVQFMLPKLLSTGRRDYFYCWIMKRICLLSLLTQGTVHCFYCNHSGVCILSVYQLYIALKNSTMKQICSLHGMCAKGPHSLRVINLVQHNILSEQLTQNHKGCFCSFRFSKQDTVCSLESFSGVGRPFIPPVSGLCGKIG